MYKLKELPEDFIVKEKSTIEIGDEGEYTYFLLKKKNYTTHRALEHIAGALRKPLKDFGFAGSKDKAAITEQVCSVKNVSEERLEGIEIPDLELKFLGRGNRPVSLGLLEGNFFEVVVRNIDELPEIKNTFVNLFGEQRFSKHNVEIGEAIIKKDFKKALNIILKIDEVPDVRNYLEGHPTDFVGALKKVHFRILKLYVHSFQSKLWNDQAPGSTEEFVPIIGFGTAMTPEIKEVLAHTGLKPRDFINRQLPELSVEGDERKRLVNVRKLEVSSLENGFGKKKVTLKFFLPKGSYATEFIRQSFA